MAGGVNAAPVATRYTYDFVRRSLPEGARSVLEIGCGNGELAVMLAGDGLQVVAIDSDEDCVTAARSRGVEARQIEWPGDLGQGFDALLFTRSLHHIHELDGAVAAAVKALEPGGRIIVEDFRFELDSRRTKAWFIGLMRLLEAGKICSHDFGTDALLERLDFGGHEHELHSSSAMADALSRCGPLEQEPAAYYFRYAEPDLDEAVTQQLLRHELELIEAGVIDALGQRFVVRT